MSIRKILRNGLNIFLVLIFVSTIGYFVASYFFDIKFVYPYIVQSGSMEPEIQTGSLVFSYPVNSYNPGDIITFSNGSADNLITHRVEFKLYPDGVANQPVYLTSGDANENFDRWEVFQSDVVGKVVFTVPYLGYAANFAKQPQGFILLVIIPATIIIYEELKILSREIISFLKRFREEIKIKVFAPKKDKSPDVFPKKEPVRTYIDIDERTVNLSPKAGLKKSSILLPLIGSAFVLVSLSASFFSDTELSTGNIFQASESFLDAGDIVINEVYYFVHNDHKVSQSEAGSEWAELYNNTGGSIVLDGWSISDNTSCDNLPTSTILSGGFAILTVVSEADFRVVWDPISLIPIGTTFIQAPSAIGNGLANNDELMLRSGLCPSGGIIIDHISWGSNVSAFNPSIPMTDRGNSSERSPDGIDTDTNADFVEQETPTPGI